MTTIFSHLRVLGLVALLSAAAGSFALGGSATPVAQAQEGETAIYDAGAVWTGDARQCTNPIMRECCVHQLMWLSGASAEAIEFYDSTGWFLTEFRMTNGPVALGKVLMPWRANANEDYVLLNGAPSPIFAEEEAQDVDITTDDAYYRLAAIFRPPFPTASLDISPPDEVFEQELVSPSGGQRFVFQYEIVNGCRDCGTGYMARVALDFDPFGVYNGASLIGICNATAEIALTGIGACPNTQP